MVAEKKQIRFPGSVLIVDDDPDLRALLESDLKSRFDQVLIAENGPDAVSIALEHRPTVVITDLNIPGYQGLSAIAKLKSGGLAPIVIVISGENNQQNVITALRLGVADFIEKPFSTDEIVIRIERAIFVNAKEGVVTGGDSRKMSGLVRTINAFGARRKRSA